nr:hypothetical protein [Methanohalophilus profundi]
MEFPKTGKMIIMAVGPYHSVHVLYIVFKQLLAQVWPGVQQNFPFLGFYKDRTSETVAFPALLSILAGGTTTTDDRCTGSISCAQ